MNTKNCITWIDYYLGFQGNVNNERFCFAIIFVFWAKGFLPSFGLKPKIVMRKVNIDWRWIALGLWMSFPEQQPLKCPIHSWFIQTLILWLEKKSNTCVSVIKGTHNKIIDDRQKLTMHWIYLVEHSMNQVIYPCENIKVEILNDHRVSLKCPPDRVPYHV